MSSGPASGLTGMETERVTASTTIEAAPEAVFAVLADPSAHADIDGTGWVRESLDGDRITAAGQVFRMAMYHPNHPDKDYKIANRVEVFDEPRAIAWQPGTESPETGELSFGGWIWRYDLEATGPSRTTVTLTYDWSAVAPRCASTSSSRRSARTTSTTRCSTCPTLSPGTPRHDCLIGVSPEQVWISRRLQNRQRVEPGVSSAVPTAVAVRGLTS